MASADTSKDAFGHALVDWAKGGTTPEVYERDDGSIDIGAGPDLFLAGFRRWPAAERQAVRYARGRVLDVGCGGGRVARHLQDRGLDVTALDASPLAIRVARSRGVHRTRCARLEETESSISAFDTVVLFGNNAGIFGTPGRVREGLVRWAHEMPPGARVLAESTSPYGGGVPTVDAEHLRQDRKQGRSPGQLRLRVRYRQWATEWFDWLFFSETEFRRVVRGTGWDVVAVLASESSEPFVAVLEKH